MKGLIIHGKVTEVMFIRGSLCLYIQVQLLFKKIRLACLYQENRKGIVRLEEDVMREGVNREGNGIHVVKKLKEEVYV